MSIKRAIETAELWKKGKMIGHDDDEVIRELYIAFNEALELLKHATDVIDELTDEIDGKHLTRHNANTDVSDKVKWITAETNKFFNKLVE